MPAALCSFTHFSSMLFSVNFFRDFCYGLPVLVSDIPANREVELPAERYFRCGDIDELKEKMEVLLEKELSEEERKEIRKQVEEKYNWDKIAEQTIEVYRKALGA